MQGGNSRIFVIGRNRKMTLTPFFACFHCRFEKQELHEMQDELEDLRDCGLVGCRPKVMQGLANIKVRLCED
jgi:hypothetical protein